MLQEPENYFFNPQLCAYPAILNLSENGARIIRPRPAVNLQKNGLLRLRNVVFDDERRPHANGGMVAAKEL